MPRVAAVLEIVVMEHANELDPLREAQVPVSTAMTHDFGPIFVVHNAQPVSICFDKAEWRKALRRANPPDRDFRQFVRVPEGSSHVFVRSCLARSSSF